MAVKSFGFGMVMDHRSPERPEPDGFCSVGRTAEGERGAAPVGADAVRDGTAGAEGAADMAGAEGTMGTAADGALGATALGG